MYEHTHAPQGIYGGQRTTRKSLFFYYHLCSGDRIQVIKLGGKHFYPLTNLIGPTFYNNNPLDRALLPFWPTLTTPPAQQPTCKLPLGPTLPAPANRPLPCHIQPLHPAYLLNLHSSPVTSVYLTTFGPSHLKPPGTINPPHTLSSVPASSVHFRDRTHKRSQQPHQIHGK